MELPLPSWDVPRLGPTDRLVGLPPMRLTDAVDGDTPRLTTAVRVGARGGALLVRFDGRDRGVVATLTKRDDPLWKEDVFEVFLSPGNRPAIYYEFEVKNCPGFSASVRRREGRWSAVFKIPLAPMASSAALQWRANFYRIDRGERDEYSAWCPTGADPPDFHRPERFGYLRLPE